MSSLNMVNEKVWTVKEIKVMLKTNPKAVERGILAIYKYQTREEQNTESTREHNGVGFNAFDAEIMSGFAKWLEFGKKLSKKQFEIAQKKIVKYAGQLTRIANGEM